MPVKKIKSNHFFSWKYLLILILLASAVRLAFLNVIPAGISFEEIDYLLNAKTVYTAWTDISGTWNPLSLSTPPADEPRGELLPILIAPMIGPLPFSLFNARLPFALIGILFVVLIYLLSRKLFNESIGQVAGLIAAINPWLIFSSRLGYDVPTSATFYLLALVIFVYANGPKILFTIPALFIAFHTYIGAKVILLPFTTIALWHIKSQSGGKISKPHLLVAIAAMLIFCLFLFRLHSLPANLRATNFFTPAHQDITSLVNNQRRLSLEVNSPISLLNSFFVNRGSLYVKSIINRTLGAFDFSVLFVSGDVYSAYFLWDHGIFYYTDVVFLLIGLYFLVRKYPKNALLFGLMFSIFLIPALVSGTKLSYVYRSYLLYAFLTIIIGLGIWVVLNRFQRKSKILAMVIVMIYLLEFLNFAQDYFIRNPFYHDSQFQLTHRVVSRYLLEEGKTGRKIVVVGADPNQLLRQYILYSGLFDKLKDSQIRNSLAKRFRDKEYYWNNIIFTSDCEVPNLGGEETVIWRYDKYCQKIAELPKDNILALARISDSGQDFIIYFGKTCHQFELPHYIRSVKFSDLNIERLSMKQYCQTYFEE